MRSQDFIAVRSGDCIGQLNDKQKGLDSWQIFRSTSASEIRSKLADFQNQGYEICGLCVSRFYADPE